MAYASPDCDQCEDLFCSHRRNAGDDHNNMLICGLCEIGEKAEGRCEQCDEYLCDGCIIRHLKLKVTSDHKIIPLQDFQELQDEESIEHRQRTYSIRATKEPPDTLVCRKHRGEAKKFYCNDCQEMICRDCILMGHKSHRAVDIDDAAEEIKQDISRIIGDIKLRRLNVSQEREDLAFYKRNIDSQFGSISDMFRKKYQEISTCLNESFADLNKKLSELQETEHERIKLLSCDLENKEESSEVTIQSTQNAILSLSSIDILQRKEELKSDLFQHLFDFENCHELGKAELFVLVNPTVEILRSENIIGNISLAIINSSSLGNLLDSNIHTFRPKRECLFNIWESRNNRPIIRGIAEADGHLWIATSRSLVRVSLDGFKRTNVQLTSNSDIMSISTGPSGKLLVGFNRGNNIKVLYKDTWSNFATVPDNISHITTSRDSQRVFVSVCNSRGDSQKIVALGADGKLKQHITFPYQTGITKTSISCLTTNPSGYICLCDTTNSRVLFCNQHMEIMHEYLCSDKQFYPKGVTFDSLGYTFVADSGNKTVQVLNTGGTFLMNILTSETFQEIGAPVALSFDHKDRLWIGTDMGTVCCYSY